MGCNEKGLGKRNQCILIPTIVKMRFKHELLYYDGRNKNSMDSKTNFVKKKEKVEVAFPLEEGETMKEDVITLPLLPSCGIS